MARIGAQDKQAEFRHNQQILDSAEKFWGWNTPAGEARGLRRARMILEHLRPETGKRFLELGCGKGWFTRRIQDCPAGVTAIDIFAGFLQTARRNTGHGKARFAAADAERLPFDDGTFDGVYGVSVLHHMPEETVLREVLRVLKPGGSLRFSEPNMLNPQLMVIKNVGWIGRRFGESPNDTAFFEWRLRGLLRRVGFCDIRVRPFDFLHPWTPPSMIGIMQRLGRLLEHLPLIRHVAGSLDILANKAGMGIASRSDGRHAREALA